MHIQLLGPLRATVNGQSIVPTARKPRQVLALLALSPGRVTPVTTLMEEIWGTEPPQSAMTTLQTYIMQLRRCLSHALGHDTDAAKTTLATGHGGYLLQIPPESVDVYTYEEHVTQGQQAFEKGHDEQAAHHFRQALTLWQGPAMVDVHTGPILKIQVMRLQESRLMTTERRIDADLRLGRHAELIAELTDLIARHPQHEGLHAQAMVAMYRSGRQATALDIYRNLRTRLTTQLGVEPSPQLQHLHQAILTVNPQLDITAGPQRGSTYDRYAT